MIDGLTRWKKSLFGAADSPGSTSKETLEEMVVRNKRDKVGMIGKKNEKDSV